MRPHGEASNASPCCLFWAQHRMFRFDLRKQSSNHRASLPVLRLGMCAWITRQGGPVGTRVVGLMMLVSSPAESCFRQICNPKCNSVPQDHQSHRMYRQNPVKLHSIDSTTFWRSFIHDSPTEGLRFPKALGCCMEKPPPWSSSAVPLNTPNQNPTIPSRTRNPQWPTLPSRSPALPPSPLPASSGCSRPNCPAVRAQNMKNVGHLKNWEKFRVWDAGDGSVAFHNSNHNRFIRLGDRALEIGCGPAGAWHKYLFFDCHHWLVQVSIMSLSKDCTRVLTYEGHQRQEERP